MDDVIPTSDEALLLKFVGLKAQMRVIREEISNIYPEVIDILKTEPNKREIGGAFVKYQTRNKYKYSETISEKTEEIRVLKRHERETGAAEIESVSESVFVRFPTTEDKQPS